MSQARLPSQPHVIIDLTDDNETVPQPSRTVDLTLLNEYDISSNVSSGPEPDVDTQTPSLTSSHGQTQDFVISPKTQHDSNDSTSDDEMTLGGILTRCRKRKRAYDSVAVPKVEPDDTLLLLTKKALQSFPEVQSLKPNVDFWTAHQTVTAQPGLPRRQPEHKLKDKSNGRTSNLGKRSDPHILNIDIDEIFGCEDKKTHGNQNRTQHSKPNGHEPTKSASADTHSSLGFSARTIELAKKSTTNVDTEEQHAHKRTRLRGPEGSTTKGVPRTNANDHTNPGILKAHDTTNNRGHIKNTETGVAEREVTVEAIAENIPADAVPEIEGVSNHTGNSHIISRARFPSFAFDDAVSNTSLTPRRRTGNDTLFPVSARFLPASKLNATQGISRPSSSSWGRSKQSWKSTKPSSSLSHKQPGRRSLSPVTASQPRRKPVTPPHSQSERIKRLPERPFADGAQFISSRPNKTATQQERKNKDSQDLAEDALAQQHFDDLFGSDTSSRASCAILDVQRSLANQNETQLERREPTGVGGSRVHQTSDGHTRQQQHPLPLPKPQPKTQPKPSTTKLPTNPLRPEPNRPYATRDETFEDAAASFNLLQSQYEKKRTATILDSVPADFGMPSRASRTQAAYRANHFGRRPRRNNARSAENKRARYREKAIEDKRKKLEEEFADEPEAYREALVKERLDEYRQKFVENDRKRKGQAQNYLTVDFIEDGAGIEDAHEDDNIPAGNGSALAMRPKGVIPASQAMGPKDTMVIYAVYISEPFEEGEEYEKYMQRTAEAFLKKEEANAFAQKLLTGISSSSRQPRQDATSVWYKTDCRGLIFGRKSLPDGKVICCMVEKETQVFGLLDMSNKWVKEEVKDLYRARFIVTVTNIIPKVFIDKEEEDKEKRKEQKANETAAATEKQPEEGEVQTGEKRQESPWVWKLNIREGEDDGKSDRDSLFSPTPSPEPEATQEADECPLRNNNNSMDNGDGDSDDTDTDSIASDTTLRPSHPGGALGKLSCLDVEYITMIAGSYTDLRLANEEAYEAALAYWKPRKARMEAWLHYNYAIVPSIKEARDMDVDAGPVDIVFHVPDIDGLVEHRPWKFINSRVQVVESKLEGPRDIASDFVLADSEDE